MKFSLDSTFEILQTTPKVLKALFGNVSENWINNNEGGNTWSPYQIVTHLIVCEKSLWMTRLKIILNNNKEAVFKMIDGRPLIANKSKTSITKLIVEFEDLRNENFNMLRSYNINNDMLSLSAMHPHLGKINLKQLISAWAVHDLNHLVFSVPPHGLHQ